MTLVGAAVEEGQFVACDPDLVAVSVLSFDEGIQKRFGHQDQHGTGGANPFSHAPRGADELADFAATTMLRALLRRPGDLARLQKQAARCGDG